MDCAVQAQAIADAFVVQAVAEGRRLFTNNDIVGELARAHAARAVQFSCEVAENQPYVVKAWVRQDGTLDLLGPYSVEDTVSKAFGVDVDGATFATKVLRVKWGVLDLWALGSHRCQTFHGLSTEISHERIRFVNAVAEADRAEDEMARAAKVLAEAEHACLAAAKRVIELKRLRV